MGETRSNSVDQKVGDSLLSAGKIDPDDIVRAQELQRNAGLTFGTALIRIGAVSEDTLLEELSIQMNLRVAVEEDLPDVQVIYKFMVGGQLNFDWFFSKEVVVWEQPDQGSLFCIARSVFDPSVTEVLRRFYRDKEICRMLAPAHVLERILEDLKREHTVENLFSDEESRHLRELAEEAPVVEFVNNILAQAVDLNASDIHIEPEENEFKVRFRIDGVLYDKISQPIGRFAAIASRIKLVSGLDIAEKRLPQDGRMTTRMGGLDMDVRVSSVPCVHGESVVLRLLPKNMEESDLSNLGMESDHLELMQRWSRLSSGIILVTGPTGSGKSTTLHAALTESNDGARKIITVEDPVEKQVPGVTQIQIHEEIGYSFANALRAILRQDPEVIMIGEIRDLDTAEIAIQAALSGHLVFSTLHTNDALSSFTRLIDMGLEPFLVAAPVKGVQAQRLVRSLCLNCAEDASPPKSILSETEQIRSISFGKNWKSAVGCDKCQGTGYRGRVGIYELVEVGAELQEAIVKGGTINDLKRIVSSTSQRTLFQDGLLKASKGQTTVDEIYRVINSENKP